VKSLSLSLHVQSLLTSLVYDGRKHSLSAYTANKFFL